MVDMVECIDNHGIAEMYLEIGKKYIVERDIGNGDIVVNGIAWNKTKFKVCPEFTDEPLVEF